MIEANLIETAIRSGIFQTFTRMLEGSTLEQQLSGVSSYTVFAPADIAFAYLPGETLNRLLEAQSCGSLAEVLSYHIVPGRISFNDLRVLSKATSVCGNDLLISNSGQVRIAGARLIHVDIRARNGMIHAIDRVLMPEKQQGARIAKQNH